MKPVWVKNFWSEVQTGKYGPALMLTTLRRLLAPYSHGSEEARREYLFNVIALTLSAVTGVMFLTTTYLAIMFPAREGMAIFVVALIWISFTAIFILGKYKFRKLARQIFLLALLIPCLYSLERWGLLLVMPLLGCALIIIMAVILHNSRVALFYTLIIVIALATLNWGQTIGLAKPDQTWLHAPIHRTYAIELSVVFGALFVVAWLAEREIRTGFAKAAEAQKKLQEEQEYMEIRLEERTEQLRKIHTEKTDTLLKLAQYGQEFAGYFHDLVNPITAATLNLEEINRANTLKQAVLVKKAEESMRNVINFIRSIQRQLQKESNPVIVQLKEEVVQATDVVQHKLRRNNISLHTKIHDEGGYCADPIKLFQILSNLINNAVEACAHNPPTKARHIWLSVHATTASLTIIIRDTGPGIAKEIQKDVFEPLVTTKQANQGTGLGLSIVHHIVTQDYGGSVSITETGTDGTTFTLHIPAAKRPII